MRDEPGQDFIVSELLSELKADGIRKADQIHQLQKNLIRVIAVALVVVVVITIAFLWYLNQYDFSSTQTIEQTAEGLYALIDSQGNTVAWDLTPEELESVLGGALSGGN